MAVDSIAKNITEVINAYAIPRLMKLNGLDTARCPQLSYGEINHVDLTEIGDFVTKLAQAGVLVPDANLEHYLRDLAGLPEADHSGANFGMPPVPAQQSEKTTVPAQQTEKPVPEDTQSKKPVPEDTKVKQNEKK